jgi:hypothetical protein
MPVEEIAWPAGHWSTYTTEAVCREEMQATRRAL